MVRTFCSSTIAALLLCSWLAAEAQAKSKDFPHGVASGEVTATSAILWTRTEGTATIRLEVSTNPDFSGREVFRDVIRTNGTSDFTAKVKVDGLDAATTYYYRFLQGNVSSDVGSFQTAPLTGSATSVRFAFTGDSDGTHVNGEPYYNHFEVFGQARASSPNFFVYLGDTIYADSEARESAAETLDEYRALYKENREIESLPELLRSTSTFAIWDDHEVTDDFDGQTVDRSLYGNGRQAFVEYMPLMEAGLPADASCAGNPFFRTFHWGADVDVIVLDGRSCRSESVEALCQIAGFPDPAPTLPAEWRTAFALPPASETCLNALRDPSRTMLGPLQKQMFKDALRNSTAKFKFVMNPVPIQQFHLLPYDRWEGYAAERAEILNFIRDNAIQNVVFLTTDTHANLVNEVFVDSQSDSQTIAQEFVAGPVATSTLGDNLDPILEAATQVILTSVVGMDCRHLDKETFGWIEYNAETGTASVTIKDATGAVLTDQLNPLTACTKTLGP